MNHEVHHPVAVARFVVIPGMSLIKYSLRAMLTLTSKLEAWVLQFKPSAQYSPGCPLVGPLMPASPSS